MNGQSDERSDLDRDAERFVERLAASYAPPPLSPSRRVAFDAALRQRVERRRGFPRLVPALAASTLAAGALVIALLGRTPEPPAGSAGAPEAVVAGELRSQSWAYQLLAADPLAETTGESGQAEALPPDYAAINSAFLGG
jgi:hypothetical protein